MYNLFTILSKFARASRWNANCRTKRKIKPTRRMPCLLQYIWDINESTNTHARRVVSCLIVWLLTVVQFQIYGVYGSFLLQCRAILLKITLKFGLFIALAKSLTNRPELLTFISFSNIVKSTKEFKQPKYLSEFFDFCYLIWMEFVLKLIFTLIWNNGSSSFLCANTTFSSANRCFTIKLLCLPELFLQWKFHWPKDRFAKNFTFQTKIQTVLTQAICCCFKHFHVR